MQHRPYRGLRRALALAGLGAGAWLAFAASSVLWGIPYLFIKIAVRDGVPPGVVAWVRVTIAALVLLGVFLLGAIGGAIGAGLVARRHVHAMFDGTETAARRT